MNLETYISFIISASILILIPGPTVVTIISNSISQGTKRTLLTIFGASLAHTIFIAFVAFGLESILTSTLSYFELIRWVGVIILVSLGVKKLFDKPIKNSFPIIKTDRSNLVSGFVVTITNPKSILFYGVFFPSFLSASSDVLEQYTLLGTTFVLLFWFYSILYSIFAFRLIRYLKAESNLTLINRIGGSGLILAGALLAVVRTSTK
ncbi:MAG TPA: LysE family translocator [Cyclobacteriaceae bacterium]|nr:LysE family translocator [Cyclobacteriaceae bacterium]